MPREQHPNADLAVSLTAERPCGLPLSLALDPAVAPDGTLTLDLAKIVELARGMRDVTGNPTGLVHVVITPHQEEAPTYSFADDRVVVDTGQHAAYADGSMLELTPQGFSVLGFLASRAGAAVPTDVLLDRIWSNDTDKPMGGMLHSAINKLRHRLGPELRESIRTERGIGYMALRSLKM